MKKTILVLGILILFSLQVFALEEEQSLFITITYDLNTDSFILEDIELINLPANVISEETGYELVVPGTDFGFKFQIPNVMFKDLPAEVLFDENGEQKYFPTEDEVIEIINQVTFDLQVPYSKEVTQVKILSPEGEEKLNITLQNADETQANGTDSLDNGEELTPEQISNTALTTIAVILILLSIVAYYLKKKKMI